MTTLRWPDETLRPTRADARFSQAGSNICLDFHGDPAGAELVVFSDGNHHMALHEALQAFSAHAQLNDIFYTTTPPGVALQFLRASHIDLGNLRLSLAPHVVISPPTVLDRFIAEGFIDSHRPFVRGRGVALLVPKGNPKGIDGVTSLARADVRVFLSNPEKEKVSYEIYAQWLRRMAARDGIALDFLDGSPAASTRVVYGESIHHREAPQSVADGRADVAIVFYHLALRYVRIFPDVFELVWPPAAEEDGRQYPSAIHCAVVGDGGHWGQRLLDFLLTKTVADIYRHHGLLPEC